MSSHITLHLIIDCIKNKKGGEKKDDTHQRIYLLQKETWQQNKNKDPCERIQQANLQRIQEPKSMASGSQKISSEQTCKEIQTRNR